MFKKSPKHAFVHQVRELIMWGVFRTQYSIYDGAF